MALQEIQLPPNHQVIQDRFVAACQADERVVAAFLGGSYARGAADRFSDLDLYLITSDEAYEEFIAGRAAFLRRLGEPLFLETFDSPHTLFWILSDGVEGELSCGSQSQFHHIHEGPYRVLLDKKAILVGARFPRQEPDGEAQVELLRRQIAGFWHEFSHFTKAMGRGQLWFAYGEIEAMRQICINLARLRYNFSDGWVGDEPYFKIEDVMPVEPLSPLRATCCPMEPGSMLQAARLLLRFYQESASALAAAHGLAYPAELESLLVNHMSV